MLKGEGDTELDFWFGLLVFMIFITIIFGEWLAPPSFLEIRFGESEREILAVQFANLARYYFQQELGNGLGDIDYDMLQLHSGKELSKVGLSENIITIRNLITEKHWGFGSMGGKGKHDTFVTVSSSYVPVAEKSQVVMETGKEYIIHIHGIGSNGAVAFDIYGHPVCGSGEEGKEPQSYKVPNCDKIKGLKKTSAGVSELKGIISTVREDSWTAEVLRTVPGSDITAKELLVGWWNFGSPDECAKADDDYICFRMMGDFVFPAVMHVETEKGREIVVSPAEREEA